MRTAVLKSERHHKKHGRLGRPMVLSADHAAVVEGRTLFPGRVEIPNFSHNLFKSGINSSKIGSRVTKGGWTGLPIYTLTLEERATCSTKCGAWQMCYGNHMHWSTRWKAGPELERIIPGQIQTLARKHPGGFVVRLHVLGDFYSRQYVKMWLNLMSIHPQLHAYGYTRWSKSDPQGSLIGIMNQLFPNRWAIRWSERGGEMGTVTISDVTARGRIAAGIVCPAQTEGDDVSCGSCGLCWNSREPIVFINH